MRNLWTPVIFLLLIRTGHGVDAKGRNGERRSSPERLRGQQLKVQSTPIRRGLGFSNRNLANRYHDGDVGERRERVLAAEDNTPERPTAWLQTEMDPQQDQLDNWMETVQNYEENNENRPSTDTYSFDLSPFQLFFVSPTPGMQEMKLLELTMRHLTRCLKQVFSDQLLDHVEMFQLIRDAAPDTNRTGTMVAFGGQAHFSYLPTLGIDLDILGEATWLAFLGTNAEKYLTRLQASGFADVEQVDLYTLDGSHVYLEDGVLRITGQPHDETDESPLMDNMSMAMLAVAIGVPVFVFALVCVFYGLLQCRGYSLCPQTGIDPLSTIWQSKSYFNGRPVTHNQLRGSSQSTRNGTTADGDPCCSESNISSSTTDQDS